MSDSKIEQPLNYISLLMVMPMPEVELPTLNRIMQMKMRKMSMEKNNKLMM